MITDALPDSLGGVVPPARPNRKSTEMGLAPPLHRTTRSSSTRRHRDMAGRDTSTAAIPRCPKYTVTR